MTLYLPTLKSDDITYFPDIEQALTTPDGLLAMGGDLSPQRLLNAYHRGIFPWYSQGDPILWWSPGVRGVFDPFQFSPSKSVRKYDRKTNYQVTLNRATAKVIELCATTRAPENTWITPKMIAAYQQLASLGCCHSVEVWQNEKLIGGLYGVQVGQLFCGESMFSLASNASKIALWKFIEHFIQCDGKLIDCQMMNPHLKSLGAQEMERALFKKKLMHYSTQSVTDKCYQPQSLS